MKFSISMVMTIFFVTQACGDSISNSTPALAQETPHGLQLPEALNGIRLAFTGSGDSNTMRTIRFDQVVDELLHSNLDLALAVLEESIAYHRLSGEKNAFLPAVRVGGAYAHTDGRVQGSFGDLRDVNYDHYDGRAGLIYRVNLGQQLHEKLAAQRMHDQSRYQKLDTQQKLLLGATELYQNLILAKAGVEITRELVDDDERFLRIIEVRTAKGVGLAADLARAQAKLAFDKEEEAQARNAWVRESIALAHVLRWDPYELLVPVDAVLEPLSAVRDIAPIDMLEMDRPDIKAGEMQAAAADEKRKAAQWELWSPSLLASAEYSMLGDDISDLDDNQHYGVFFAWTLSLENVDRIKKEHVQAAVAVARLQQLKDDAQAEVARAINDTRTAIDRIGFAQQAREAAETNVELSLARYKAGKAILIEALDAQNTLAKARLNLASAITAYNVAQVRYLASSGEISRDSLLPFTKDKKDQTTDP